MKFNKILLVGEYTPISYAWNCLKILKKLGYNVATSDYANHFITSHAPLPRMQRAIGVVNNFIINKNFLTSVRREKPDLIFLLKAHNLTEKTLLEAKKMSGAQLINWYPDNPFTLWNGNSNENILKALPLYDCFVIWSHMLVDPLLSAGCRKVHYAPFAYDEELYTQEIPISPEDYQKFSSPVSFIGSWDPDRQWWLEELVQRLPDLKLTIWGNGWDEALPSQSPLRRFAQKQPLIGPEMLKVFRLSTISLNFIRRQNMTAHNMRSIEIPAAGGFQLAQRTHEQSQLLFKEPQTIACFDTPDELAHQVQFFLENNTAREQITHTAHQHVQQYQLGNILEKIFANIPSRTEPPVY